MNDKDRFGLSGVMFSVGGLILVTSLLPYGFRASMGCAMMLAGLVALYYAAAK